jgi:hypothetical protein
MIKKLSGNTDLYDYLVSLGNLLADRGAQQLSASVCFAARQATGLSTEFLGEALIALRDVLEKGGSVLKSAERDELIAIVSQVEFALRR